MKILVADKIAQAGVAFLREQPGYEVIEAYDSSPEKLKGIVGDVDAIIVRSATSITADIFAAAPKLKCVGRAGVGVDNVDVEAASQRGVVVMNTPDGNTIATAELTFTHLLCSARPIAQASASMRGGQWDKKSFNGTELSGKTLGILGLGRIGSEVAKRAKAFNMRVLAYDPYLTAARAAALEIEVADLDSIFRQADFITVHMPKTEATTNMVNAEAFAKMKKGVRILNCARGGLINEPALLDALKSGKVAAAGLDVFDKEPIPADSAFRTLPNVVTTPHLGASTVEAQESVGIQIAEYISEALNGGMIRNAVNMPSVDPAMLKVLRPYLTLGEMLGSILQQIAPQGITRLAITYWGKIVELDAMPLTRAIQRGFLRKIQGREINDVSAPHHIKRLGIAVDVTKSNTDSDYMELIRVEAIGADGQTASLEGTIIGKSHKPRLTKINERNVEITPEKYLIVMEHEDVVGIVGLVGNTMAKYQVNIANMSLSRTVLGGVVSTLIEVDSVPPAGAFEDIQKHPAMKKVLLVEI
ncbi:MAG: phosphoglycerate dehydrogenase [Verrucomicrobiota bacterium]|nr:phosphoglycerate dehydrogenase [Verrucomicrobiota bacterium]